MTDEEFEALITQDIEGRRLEFKGPGPLTDGRLVAQVTKAALGMANNRDGGNIVVGVAEIEGSPVRTGLEIEDLATWSFDALADQLARYADPNVSFTLAMKEFEDKQFLLIEVREFDEIPVLCKRAHSDLLREGACYVRTSRKPETSELPTQTEMRELLGLATEKGVRRYIEQLERLGIIALPSVTLQVEDDHSFNEELGESL